MTWRQFRRYAKFATEELGVEPQESPYMRSVGTSYAKRHTAKSFGESVLHEVAHGVTLGIGYPFSPARITGGLQGLNSNCAREGARNWDLNEIRTIAALLAFCDCCGLTINAATLSEFAVNATGHIFDGLRVERLAVWLSRLPLAKRHAAEIAEALEMP